ADAERNTNDKRDGGEEGSLPEHRRRHLAAREPERLQNGEIAPPPTYGARHQVSHRRHAEDAEYPGQNERKTLYPAEVDDVVRPHGLQLVEGVRSATRQTLQAVNDFRSVRA